MLYDEKKSVIDFFDEFTSRASEARHQAKHGLNKYFKDYQ